MNEVDPDLVVHDTDSCIGIEYNHLLVYAVEEIKKLKTEIQTLRTQIENLVF